MLAFECRPEVVDDVSLGGDEREIGATDIFYLSVSGRWLELEQDDMNNRHCTDPSS